jgi:hypothetical protein
MFPQLEIEEVELCEIRLWKNVVGCLLHGVHPAAGSADQLSRGQYCPIAQYASSPFGIMLKGHRQAGIWP